MRQNTINGMVEDEPRQYLMMELTQSLGKSRTQVFWEVQSWDIRIKVEVLCSPEPQSQDILAPDQLCRPRLLMHAGHLLLEEDSTSWREEHHLSKWRKFGISSSHPLLLESIVSAWCVI
ncbi:hypothetical protein Nmel_005692 [Mimus melanotis]